MKLGLGFDHSVASPAATVASLYADGSDGVWYDPSDLSTLFQDTAGTTPVAVGDPVGRINDKSGNGHHALQATAGNRPILRQDGSNYYLEFDGTNDTMTVVAGITASFFTSSALRIESGGGSHPGPFSFTRTGGDPASGSANVLEEYTDNSWTRRAVLQRYPGTVIYEDVGSRPALANDHVSWNNNGTTFTGGTLYPASPNQLVDRGAKAGADDATSTLHLARGYAGTYLKGRLYGFIYLARAATTAERVIANNHLMSKSGITL